MGLSLIVAMDEGRVIGANNAMPWHLPADLRHFREVTMGKPIVMGRKTFESIGKALPGRRNIVISANPDFVAAGCMVVPNLQAALESAADAPEIMIIGGATIFAQTLAQADRLYLTVIHHRFDGDTWFPEIDAVKWREVARSDHAADERNPYDYSFITLERAN